MSKPKRKSRKQVLKLITGKCALCPEDRYVCLEVHRIRPGAEGGRYTEGNCLVLCSNCHDLVTAGTIEIIAIRMSTAHPLGVVEWLDENKDKHFTPLPIRGDKGR